MQHICNALSSSCHVSRSVSLSFSSFLSSKRPHQQQVEINKLTFSSPPLSLPLSSRDSADSQTGPWVCAMFWGRDLTVATTLGSLSYTLQEAFSQRAGTSRHLAQHTPFTYATFQQHLSAPTAAAVTRPIRIQMSLRAQRGQRETCGQTLNLVPWWAERTNNAGVSYSTGAPSAPYELRRRVSFKRPACRTYSCWKQLTSLIRPTTDLSILHKQIWQLVAKYPHLRWVIHFKWRL